MDPYLVTGMLVSTTLGIPIPGASPANSKGRRSPQASQAKQRAPLQPASLTTARPRKFAPAACSAGLHPMSYASCCMSSRPINCCIVRGSCRHLNCDCSHAGVLRRDLGHHLLFLWGSFAQLQRPDRRHRQARIHAWPRDPRRRACPCDSPLLLQLRAQPQRLLRHTGLQAQATAKATAKAKS